MKIYMAVLKTLALILISFKVNAQDQVLKSSLKLNNQVQLGEFKSEVIKLLGEPSKVEQVYMEMDGIYSDKLYYTDSYLLFEEGKLVSFQILDSNLYVQLDTTMISFGENISHYQAAFPNSYSKRFSYYVGPMMVIKLKAISEKEEIVLDEYLSIRFDSQKGTVNAIQYIMN